jgi:protein-tyrosine-phosphatase
VLGRIADWFKSNGVRKRDGQKLIVFVSYGGTDRCAIAKVIANHLLMKDNCTLDFRVESRAAFNPSASSAAKTGIEVVQRKLGEDLLGSHRPQHAGPAFLFEADVVLATDGAVRSKLMDAFRYYPGSEADQGLVREEIERKTYLLSEFFGGIGDIEDPYPDRGDPESTRKYEKCFDDLRHLISNGLPRLTELLERASPPTVRTVSFGDRRLLGTT